jgi:1-deoxy-D-xylulose-5-phosphate synthase
MGWLVYLSLSLMIPYNPLLQNLQSPADLRKIKSNDELIHLAQEVREYLVETLSQIDHIHFSANMGVVELSIALHYVFDTPHDELFWDIGHQGYVHKILTGRQDRLARIRSKSGISGFLTRAESAYDNFGAGHAGTSISAALGASVASKLANAKKHFVAIIGDSSLQCGMAFEALNHLSDFKDLNLTIVINDNNCSIDPSVGGLGRHLQKLYDTSSDSIFNQLGLPYQGPINGHDMPELLNAFKSSKAAGGIKIIHCRTTKGKGFGPAEKGVSRHWHAPGKFDKRTGASLKTHSTERYQDVFARTLIDLAEVNLKIVCVSAGMLSGTSLNEFQNIYPTRCFDVGIAEQHAVTFSAGLATQGYIPFCAIYSTFLQRALDQVIHDVALQNLPVIFCVDRSGLVGHDGATHQGVFDISFLRCVPNLIIAAPSSAEGLRDILFTAQLGINSPLVIRYPRGNILETAYSKILKRIPFGKSKINCHGQNIMIIGIGTIVQELEQVKLLLTKEGIDAGICDALFIKPLDEELLNKIFLDYRKIVTVEEHALIGGFGSAVAEFLVDGAYKNKLLRIGIPDEFVEHASQQEQREQFGLDANGIAQKILTWIED